MNRFNDLFKKADASFDADYEAALTQLKGLSADEIATLIPDTNSKEVYKELVAIVEEASRKNISQAELISKVDKLGSIAKKIIGKIPALAGLF